MWCCWIFNSILLFNKKSDNDINYDKIIEMMKQQTEKNLETLKDVNKKINKIESKILKKKELGMKLFDK